MGLLEQIDSPADLRALPMAELPALAEEIRRRVLEVVGRNGGHLTSNLGVTELTVALHRVFDFSQDRLLWDVGHQCYPHKLLTGRNERFDMLRKSGGPSGFPSPTESPFDLFDVGHAGTAIPTAVGMARADQLQGRDACVVVLVVLDDVKARTKRILPRLPLLGKPVFEMIAHLKEGIKATVSPDQIFEAMGLQYVGPVDGHDIRHLIGILEILKKAHRPVLLHVHTVKGNGCAWARAAPGKFHSPRPFVVESGKVTIKSRPGKSWTNAFVECLIELAETNDRIFALTAGMPDGTGLARFAQRFPNRWRDVGISESCTVDMAAGMCRAGLRPVVAIYSTFLQRAFDQVFQEVALQGLPVMFCLDRAGLVGGDGAVHHGFLDLAYLRGLPGMVLMAPIDEVELAQAMRLALTLDRPCAIRYPRDDVPASIPDCPRFELGKSRRLREGGAATLLCYGPTTTPALAAAGLLAENGVEVSVVNARFARPIDRAMVEEAFDAGGPVLTVEDHSVVGGFGSAVLETAQEMGMSGGRVLRLGMPGDRFIAHGSRSEQLAECGIDATGIASAVEELLGIEVMAGPLQGRLAHPAIVSGQTASALEGVRGRTHA